MDRRVVATLLLCVLAFAGAACKDDAAEYRRKSMQTEGRLRLQRIVIGAKVALTSEGQYPVATTELTPATPCCEGPDHVCAPDPAAWEVEPWRTLGVSVDEPGRYRLSYASDGKTFSARAVADLDCDGQLDSGEELTATGAIDAQGSPVVIVKGDK